MECTSCFELYDQDEHVPLNFPCGHTFCRICIEHIATPYHTIQCPICKVQFKITSIGQLSKNYIALGLADESRQQSLKQVPTEDTCQIHQETLRYYCQTDKQKMCPSCIVDHSGHTFMKLELSSIVLEEKANKVGDRMTLVREGQERAQKEIDNQLQEVNWQEKHQTETVEKQLDAIITLMMEHSRTLVSQLREQADEKRERLNKTGEKVEDSKIVIRQQEEEIKRVVEGLKEEEESLDHGETKGILESLDSDLQAQQEKNSQLERDLANQRRLVGPRLQVDYLQMSSMKRLMRLEEKVSIDRLCVFGYKDKMLELDMTSQKWQLRCLKAMGGAQVEFQYYSAGVSTSCGEVILTGGSATRQVLLVDLINRHITELSPMIDCRKEHCALILDQYMYVLGGYNAQTNKFLDKCERYSLMDNSWSPISPMSQQKCAFSACLVQSQRCIYVFGGYTGSKRIAEIEVYSIDNDRWSMYALQLQIPLSNSAAVYNPQGHQIVLLGGGHSDGFLNNIYVFDLKSDTMSIRQNQNEGKDLRNKLVYYQNQIYMVGGHQQQLERICLQDYSQTKLANSYAHLLQDNLDSWAACLTSYSRQKGLAPSLLIMDEGQNYHLT